MIPSPGEELRELASQGLLRVVGAPNALAAKIIEQRGFEAIYLSGAVLSAGTLGVPDVGLFSLTELAQQATYLTRASALPLIVDADTGFGEALQVERTMIELESAGAAAIQIEDQQLPKRCGHLSGKSLVEIDVMCAKIRAACNARIDPNLIVLARTDARGVDGFDAAVERAKRYLDAGADWIFPEAMESRDEFEKFAKAVEAPLIANMTEFGRGPLLKGQELHEMGYAAVLYPVTLMRIASQAITAALALLDQEDTQEELLDLMLNREELYELIGYSDFEERDRVYFRGQEE